MSDNKKWWCLRCQCWIRAIDVTADARHAPGTGGCGYGVELRTYATNGDGKPVSTTDMKTSAELEGEPWWRDRNGMPQPGPGCEVNYDELLRDGEIRHSEPPSPLYVVCATDKDGRVMEFVELEDEFGCGVGPDSGATWRDWGIKGLKALGPFFTLGKKNFHEHGLAIAWAAGTLWSPVSDTPPTFGDYLVWWNGGEWRASWVPGWDHSTETSYRCSKWVIRGRFVGALWWKKPLVIKPSHWRKVDGLKPAGVR